MESQTDYIPNHLSLSLCLFLLLLFHDDIIILCAFCVMLCILPSYLVVFLPVVPTKLLLYFSDRMLNNDVADSYCAVVVTCLLVNLMMQYHAMLLFAC